MTKPTAKPLQVRPAWLVLDPNGQDEALVKMGADGPYCVDCLTTTCAHVRAVIASETNG